MAVTVERFIPARNYPWRLWTNGKAWLAFSGEDYHCSDSSFRAALYSHAKRNGLTVRVTTTTKGVSFVFEKPRKSKARGGNRVA